MASENVITILADAEIPVAPDAGLLVVIVGAVISDAAVVKVESDVAANAFPAKSFTPAPPPTARNVWPLVGSKTGSGVNSYSFLIC